jgi:hypothetical protein
LLILCRIGSARKAGLNPLAEVEGEEGLTDRREGFIAPFLEDTFGFEP